MGVNVSVSLSLCLSVSLSLCLSVSLSLSLSLSLSAPIAFIFSLHAFSQFLCPWMIFFPLLFIFGPFFPRYFANKIQSLLILLFHCLMSHVLFSVFVCLSLSLSLF